MHAKWVSFKRSIRSLVVLFAIPAFQCSYAGQENTGLAPKEHMDMIRRVYEFNRWAGKVKSPHRKIDKLEIDPNFFNAISTKTRIFTGEPNRAMELDLTIVDKNTKLEVDIDIVVAKDAKAAHSSVINFLSLCTAPPPVARRIDPNDPKDPLNIGDVCFVFGHKASPKNGKPVWGILMFCRDNVSVMLRNSGDETRESYPDIGRIALLIDKRLKEISKPIR